MSENYIDKNAKEVPPVASGAPVNDTPDIFSYENLETYSRQFWKDRDLDQCSNFKQGATFSSNITPDSYDAVLKNLLYILETGLKNSNTNEQLLTNVQITAIFKSLMASIEILKTLKPHCAS